MEAGGSLDDQSSGRFFDEPEAAIAHEKERSWDLDSRIKFRNNPWPRSTE
jgi:hypothetical protein